MFGYERYGAITLWKHLKAILLIMFERYGTDKMMDSIADLMVAYDHPEFYWCGPVCIKVQDPVDEEIPF